ncbi:MAG: hypothetical protein HYY17_08520 [Planctomycetes bacterium]|nr:hypothetical protein [Planctomycetota bacterium]
MRITIALAVLFAQESARKAETPRPRAYVEVKLKVAVRPDATAEQLEKLKDRFERAAKRWWECTEGHMAFTEIRIVDRTEEGDVIVTNLDSTHCDRKAYGRTVGERVYLGGRFPIVTFCHEMGHRWFGLPDEYDDPKCGNCVMEPWKGVFEFCDGGNHTARGADCWSRILKKHPDWKRSRPGECPPVKISVEDK